MPFFESEGAQLFFRETGNGRLLVILPGNTASSAHMQGEIEYFSKRFHTVSLDFRGTGQSSRVDLWPDGWWQLAARDTIALVHHLGEESCLAMGTSGGGWAALWMAIESPRTVTAVIADSCVERFPPGRLEENVAGRNLDDPMSASFWSSGHGSDWAQVVEADTAMIRRFSMQGGDQFRGRLAEIHCPVLLTASLSDELLPDVDWQISQMLRQIPKSQAYLCREGGHPLMWSQPDRFRQAADSFLDQLNG